MNISCCTLKACFLKIPVCSVGHHDPHVLEFTPVIPTLLNHVTSQRKWRCETSGTRWWKVIEVISWLLAPWETKFSMAWGHSSRSQRRPPRRESRPAAHSHSQLAAYEWASLMWSSMPLKSSGLCGSSWVMRRSCLVEMVGGRAEEVMERVPWEQACTRTAYLRRVLTRAHSPSFDSLNSLAEESPTFTLNNTIICFDVKFYSLLLMSLQIFATGQKKTKGRAVIFSQRTQPPPAATIPLTAQLTVCPWREGTLFTLLEFAESVISFCNNLSNLTSQWNILRGLSLALPSLAEFGAQNSWDLTQSAWF